MKDKNIFLRFLTAQFVTGLAGFFAYPLDTVRRRLMMQSGSDKVIYKGTIDCFQKIY